MFGETKKEEKTNSLHSHVSSDGYRHCDRFNRVNCIFRAHVWDAAADMTIDIQRVPVFCLFKICLLQKPFMPPLEHWHPFECFQRDLFDRLFPKNKASWRICSQQRAPVEIAFGTRRWWNKVRGIEPTYRCTASMRERREGREGREEERKRGEIDGGEKKKHVNVHIKLLHLVIIFTHRRTVILKIVHRIFPFRLFCFFSLSKCFFFFRECRLPLIHLMHKHMIIAYNSAFIACFFNFYKLQYSVGDFVAPSSQQHATRMHIDTLEWHRCPRLESLSLSEISTKHTMHDCDLAPLLVECWSMVLLLVPPPRRLFMFRQIKGEWNSRNVFFAAMHSRIWFAFGRLVINTKEWEVCTGAAYLCRPRCHTINETHRVPRFNRLMIIYHVFTVSRTRWFGRSKENDKTVYLSRFRIRWQLLTSHHLHTYWIEFASSNVMVAPIKFESQMTD